MGGIKIQFILRQNSFPVVKLWSRQVICFQNSTGTGKPQAFLFGEGTMRKKRGVMDPEQVLNLNKANAIELQGWRITFPWLCAPSSRPTGEGLCLPGPPVEEPHPLGLGALIPWPPTSGPFFFLGRQRMTPARQLYWLAESQESDSLPSLHLVSIPFSPSRLFLLALTPSLLLLRQFNGSIYHRPIISQRMPSNNFDVVSITHFLIFHNMYSLRIFQICKFWFLFA